MKQYCPRCGSYFEQTTAGHCPCFNGHTATIKTAKTPALDAYIEWLNLHGALGPDWLLMDALKEIRAWLSNETK